MGIKASFVLWPEPQSLLITAVKTYTQPLYSSVNTGNSLNFTEVSQDLHWRNWKQFFCPSSLVYGHDFPLIYANFIVG